MEAIEPRNILSDTQPDNDIQESCQEKQTRLSGLCKLSVDTVAVVCQTGAVMSAAVVVAAVAASEIREGLMPT